MAKEKSEPVRRMDEVQCSLRSTLRRWGFRGRGRTYNRVTSDGLTHVITLQMGSYDPPGTTYFPGLRENLYGRFTVNLGVYVPEVAKHHEGGEARLVVPEYKCCIRSRLGELGPEAADIWWHLSPDPSLPIEIGQRLERDGLPFLERFGTRDAILRELLSETENIYLNPPRIVCAIILAQRGCLDEARRLLAAQMGEKRNAGHPAYVRKLADKLGVGGLDA